MLTIELDLGKVIQCLKNFSPHHIEEQTVKARQDIYEKIFTMVLAQIGNKILAYTRCNCGSVILQSRINMKNHPDTLRI